MQLGAARRTHQPGDRVAQRGLAHAVAADDAEHAALQREAHALQRVRAAVVDVEAFDDQNGAGRLRRACMGRCFNQSSMPSTSRLAAVLRYLTVISRTLAVGLRSFSLRLVGSRSDRRR